MIAACLRCRPVCAADLKMRTLLTGLLLTLLPASVLCLNSVCQGGIELLATGASSDRAQGTGLTGLDVVTTTAFASSQALTTVSPRRVLRSYDLPKGFTQSSVKDSVGDNDGYRAAAYYVNWVSSPTTTLLTFLTDHRRRMLGTISHTIFLLRTLHTSSMHSRTLARKMAKSSFPKPTLTLTKSFLPKHGLSRVRILEDVWSNFSS